MNKKPNLDFYKTYNLKCEVEVTFLYLLPSSRGIGIAQKLLDIPMKKYTSICLTTYEGYTTEPAYKLYRKNNFKVIGKQGKTSYWYWSK